MQNNQIKIKEINLNIHYLPFQTRSIKTMRFQLCILILLTTFVGSILGESQSDLIWIQPTLRPGPNNKNFSCRNELSEYNENLLTPLLDRKMHSLEVPETEIKVLDERRKTKKKTFAKNKKSVERQEEFHGHGK